MDWFAFFLISSNWFASGGLIFLTSFLLLFYFGYEKWKSKICFEETYIFKLD